VCHFLFRWIRLKLKPKGHSYSRTTMIDYVTGRMDVQPEPEETQAIKFYASWTRRRCVHIWEEETKTKQHICTTRNEHQQKTCKAANSENKTPRMDTDTDMGGDWVDVVYISFKGFLKSGREKWNTESNKSGCSNTLAPLKTPTGVDRFTRLLPFLFTILLGGGLLGICNRKASNEH